MYGEERPQYITKGAANNLKTAPTMRHSSSNIKEMIT